MGSHRNRAPLHRRMFGFGEIDRGHETVAAPRYVGQISAARLTVAQRLAKAGYVDTQSVLVDECIRPDAGYELGSC